MLYGCENLSQVDLVGGFHKTISSLLLDSWRNEMKNEIDRINQDLPNTGTNPTNVTTTAIRQWMERVTERIEHYKSEHYALLKENTSLLELALWKNKLHQNKISFGSDLISTLWEDMARLELARLKTRFDEEVVTARQKARVTCGANIIIPHVLSFLNDEDIFPLLHYDHQP